METIIATVIPAVVLFTVLFGVLARGNPRPGGVALFLRVGLAGLALGGGLYYLTSYTGLLEQAPGFVRRAYLGTLIGGAALTLFGLLGMALKRRP